MHRADTPINMQVYNAQDEMDEWEVHKKLKGEYGLDDDSNRKEWLMTRKAHLKNTQEVEPKEIKQQAGKAAGSGRQGGGGPGKKQQYS